MLNELFFGTQITLNEVLKRIFTNPYLRFPFATKDHFLADFKVPVFSGQYFGPFQAFDDGCKGFNYICKTYYFCKCIVIGAKKVVHFCAKTANCSSVRTEIFRTEKLIAMTLPELKMLVLLSKIFFAYQFLIVNQVGAIKNTFVHIGFINAWPKLQW